MKNIGGASIAQAGRKLFFFSRKMIISHEGEIEQHSYIYIYIYTDIYMPDINARYECHIYMPDINGYIYSII